MKNLGFKFVGALALVVFLGGCGEKMEAPTVELFTIFYQNGSGVAKTNIMVQSKDNNTIVEDVIINQGNCGLYKYDYVTGEEYEQLAKDYYEKHKVKYAFDSYEIDDKIHYLQLNLTGANNYLVNYSFNYKVIIKEKRGDIKEISENIQDVLFSVEGYSKDEVIKKVEVQKDKLIQKAKKEIEEDLNRPWYSSRLKKDIISFEGSENNKIKKEGYFLVENFFPVFSNNEKEILEEFNKMSKKDRTLFHKKDRADALNKVIPFGEKRKFSSNCSLQQILRIDLVTNGGTFTYEFNQY